MIGKRTIILVITARII